MDVSSKVALVERNTCEVVPKGALQGLLQKKKRPVVYIGWSITGRPHIGYYVTVLKLADFLKAGFKVKLLLADLHGALDKTPWEILDRRYAYYAKMIPLMFRSVGADIENFEIVRGSSFQQSAEYILDLLKLSTLTSVHDAKKAGSEVVKTDNNPKLGGLLYPLMQALDEEYLKVDVQYGGVDQRKILMFAREHLPRLGYASRIEVMTPLIPGLTSKKMSASDPKSKIDLLDDVKTVQKKLRGAYCEAGVVENNGVLAFLRYVVMVLKQDRKETFVVERPVKFGGNLEFHNYEEIERVFLQKKLHPLDLKNALAKEISSLLDTFTKKKRTLEKFAQRGNF